MRQEPYQPLPAAQPMTAPQRPKSPMRPRAGQPISGRAAFCASPRAHGKGRVFMIAGNTATTLTVQQNEAANTDVDGVETEYTVCQGYAPDPDSPDGDRGRRRCR